MPPNGGIFVLRPCSSLWDSHFWLSAQVAQKQTSSFSRLAPNEFLSPLEYAVPQNIPVTPLEYAVTEKGGRGATAAFDLLRGAGVVAPELAKLEQQRESLRYERQEKMIISLRAAGRLRP
jgi:hypothetical protein